MQVAARYNNAHAMVNMSVWMEGGQGASEVAWQDVRVAIGCPTKLATGGPQASTMHLEIAAHAAFLQQE